MADCYNPHFHFRGVPLDDLISSNDYKPDDAKSSEINSYRPDEVWKAKDGHL